MAHVAKYKSPALAPMLGHYARIRERQGFSRANVDNARTHLNYALGTCATPDALAERVTQLVGMARASHEMASGRAVRSDAVVMCDWVVTQPQDCPDALSRVFFESCLSFIQDRYGGPQNVPGGVVHLDEPGQAHMHVPIVPVLDGKLKASKIVTRADLKTFHQQLQERVDRDLGVHVSIELAEEQKGAKELSRLPQSDYIAARRALAAAEEERKQAEQAAAAAREQAERQAAELEAVTQRLERVRRVEAAFESGELGARARRAEQDVADLKPQVRSAKAGVAELEERIRKLGERIERVRQRLVTRVKNAQRKLKPQVREGKRVDVKRGHGGLAPHQRRNAR